MYTIMYQINENFIYRLFLKDFFSPPVVIIKTVVHKRAGRSAMSCWLTMKEATRACWCTLPTCTEIHGLSVGVVGQPTNLDKIQYLNIVFSNRDLLYILQRFYYFALNFFYHFRTVLFALQYLFSLFYCGNYMIVSENIK